ncbi:MAG: homogentisate phytyltransferase [Pseudanabaenaceae cyanobacterium bins.68]|nr:homogentisate phytyltransferase [Pseudanabaenaceae cyanobacterium bins.68]
MNNLVNFCRSLWQFSRPHTVIGTGLSLTAIWLIVADIYGVYRFVDLAIALAACLGGNIYIVGLNQIFDLEIDRINKPHLPLAAADLSLNQAWAIVISTAIAAMLLSISQGIFLFLTVSLSLIIGTAYSVPPLRLKRSPWLASACILAVRGLVVNLGIFLHFQALARAQTEILPIIWLLSGFVLVFSYAIAICKDLPDMEGDAQFQILTLSLLWGKELVLKATKRLLLALYLTMAVLLWQLNFPLLALIHGAIALIFFGLFFWRCDQVDLNSQASITQFYQFIWKLFFLEYLIFPIACLLQA